MLEGKSGLQNECRRNRVSGCSKLSDQTVEMFELGGNILHPISMPICI